MEDLKTILIIGAGKQGVQHFHALQALYPNYAYVFCTSSPESAQKITEKHSIPCEYNYQEALKKYNPSILVVSVTPLYIQTQILKFLLKSDESYEHIIVEKPIVSSSKEFQELMPFMQEKNIRLFQSELAGKTFFYLQNWHKNHHIHTLSFFIEFIESDVKDLSEYLIHQFQHICNYLFFLDENAKISQQKISFHDGYVSFFFYAEHILCTVVVSLGNTRSQRALKAESSSGQFLEITTDGDLYSNTLMETPFSRANEFTHFYELLFQSQMPSSYSLYLNFYRLAEAFREEIKKIPRDFIWKKKESLGLVLDMSLLKHYVHNHIRDGVLMLDECSIRDEKMLFYVLVLAKKMNILSVYLSKERAQGQMSPYDLCKNHCQRLGLKIVF